MQPWTRSKEPKVGLRGDFVVLASQAAGLGGWGWSVLLMMSDSQSGSQGSCICDAVPWLFSGPWRVGCRIT